MARLLLILIIAATGLSAYQAPLPGNKDKQTNNASANTNNKGQEKQNGTNTLVAQQDVNTPTSQQNGQPQTSTASKPSHDWIDRLNAASTAIIAVFTILLFIGVARQISTSRDIERAWLVVEPSERSPVLGFIPEQGDRISVPGKDKPNWFGYTVKNTGNTPAKIVKSWAAYKMVAALKDIPEEPEYAHPVDVNDWTIVKGDVESFVVHLEPDRVLRKQQIEDLKTRKSFLYAYGLVAYKDAFGRHHETRFGFVYVLDSSYLQIGFVRQWLPSAYNKAT